MLKWMHRFGGRFKGELIFMLANYLTPVVGFFSSIVAARYVAPEEMGAIQTAMLLVPYLAMLHFGAFTGLNRNLAFYLGKGEPDKAMRMVSASAFMAKLNAWIGLLFGACFVACQFLSDQPSRIVMVASLAMMVTLACSPYITHISATYRSGQHFKSFGKIVFASNILRLVYAMLPVFMGWLGYVVSLALEPLIKRGLLKRKEPYPAAARFQRADLVELIKVGFPIMASAYFSGLLLVADQSLVALFMSKQELGYFALARLVVRTMSIIPVTLSILLSPRVAACYGRTSDPQALRRYFWLILLIHAVFILPLCVAAYFAVGPIVQWLLPKYVPGIGVAKITILTCLGYIFSGLLITTSTMRKNLVPIILYFIALGVMWIAGFVMFKVAHPTMEQVAWLRFYVSMALSVGTLIYAFVETGRRKGTL